MGLTPQELRARKDPCKLFHVSKTPTEENPVNTAPVVNYPNTTALIARTARNFGPMLNLTPAEAVDRVARSVVDSAHDARTRTGTWARETTTQQIDDAMFQGTVAADILDGTVARPSVGNVRAHTLALAEVTP